MFNFFSPTSGIVNHILARFEIGPISFMSMPQWFRPMYVGSHIWQNFGWESIIFIAAMSSIDPELYEAASIDGANRWQMAWSITLPCIINTVVIMLILNIGRLMAVGFEKIILLYNTNTYEVADVISTYVYRRGLQDAAFSFATAVGLFNSLVNVVFLVIANALSRRFTDSSLF